MNPIGTIFGALKYLPATLARKALEKANPGFKNYFSRSVAYGVDTDKALGYLTDKFESDAQRDYKANLERGASNQSLRPDEAVSRSQIANTERPAKIARAGLSAAVGGSLGGGGESEETQASQPQQQASQQGSLLEKFKQTAPKLYGFIEEKLSEGRKPADISFDARKDHKLVKDVNAVETVFKGSLLDILESLLGGAGQSQQPSPRQTPQTPQTPQPQGSGSEALLQAIQAYKASRGK